MLAECVSVILGMFGILFEIWKDEKKTKPTLKNNVMTFQEII